MGLISNFPNNFKISLSVKRETPKDKIALLTTIKTLTENLDTNEKFHQKNLQRAKATIAANQVILDQREQDLKDMEQQYKTQALFDNYLLARKTTTKKIKACTMNSELAKFLESKGLPNKN